MSKARAGVDVDDEDADADAGADADTGASASPKAVAAGEGASDKDDPRVSPGPDDRGSDAVSGDKVPRGGKRLSASGESSGSPGPAQRRSPHAPAVGAHVSAGAGAGARALAVSQQGPTAGEMIERTRREQERLRAAMRRGRSAADGPEVDSVAEFTVLGKLIARRGKDKEAAAAAASAGDDGGSWAGAGAGAGADESGGAGTGRRALQQQHQQQLVEKQRAQAAGPTAVIPHLSDLARVWGRFSEDGLSSDEFVAFLSGLLALSSDQLRIMFQKIDANDDGDLSWYEFLAFLYREIAYTWRFRVARGAFVLREDDRPAYPISRVSAAPARQLLVIPPASSFDESGDEQGSWAVASSQSGADAGAAGPRAVAHRYLFSTADHNVYVWNARSLAPAAMLPLAGVADTTATLMAAAGVGGRHRGPAPLSLSQRAAASSAGSAVHRAMAALGVGGSGMLRGVGAGDGDEEGDTIADGGESGRRGGHTTFTPAAGLAAASYSSLLPGVYGRSGASAAAAVAATAAASAAEAESRARGGGGDGGSSRRKRPSGRGPLPKRFGPGLESYHGGGGHENGEDDGGDGSGDSALGSGSDAGSEDGSVSQFGDAVGHASSMRSSRSKGGAGSVSGVSSSSSSSSSGGHGSSSARGSRSGPQSLSAGVRWGGSSSSVASRGSGAGDDESSTADDALDRHLFALNARGGRKMAASYARPQYSNLSNNFKRAGPASAAGGVGAGAGSSQRQRGHGAGSDSLARRPGLGGAGSTGVPMGSGFRAGMGGASGSGASGGGGAGGMAFDVDGRRAVRPEFVSAAAAQGPQGVIAAAVAAARGQAYTRESEATPDASGSSQLQHGSGSASTRAHQLYRAAARQAAGPTTRWGARLLDDKGNPVSAAPASPSASTSDLAAAGARVIVGGVAGAAKPGTKGTADLTARQRQRVEGAAARARGLPHSAIAYWAHGRQVVLAGLDRVVYLYGCDAARNRYSLSDLFLTGAVASSVACVDRALICGDATGRVVRTSSCGRFRCLIVPIRAHLHVSLESHANRCLY